MIKHRTRIDTLERTGYLERDEWIFLLSDFGEADRRYAAERAREVARQYFGKRIYIRGLIEYTSYCRNNCLYCGLRRDNAKARRYRLTEEEVLDCCRKGYDLGFRTFVLQGGEDVYDTDDRLLPMVRRIKSAYPDCALTLSLGEREERSYRRLYEAGADRYLLRHETADEAHYAMLHPQEMSLAHRKRCLQQLRDIGYQTGCGFMVGSPGQTAETLAADMAFIHRLRPHMIGIGPFLPHRDTPLGEKAAGSLQLTLFLLSLLRIMEKQVLLPATTALATLQEDGRQQGILAGANVVMPNLSPISVRDKYSLYDNKKHTGEEAAEGLEKLREGMKKIGYEIVSVRGDWEAR